MNTGVIRTRRAATGVALAAMLLMACAAIPSDAVAVNRVRLIVGMHTNTARATTWWHSGSTGNSSLDFAPYDPADTVGMSVSWQSNHREGSVGLRVTVIPDVGRCKQTRVSTKPNGGTTNLGDYWFLHVDNSVAPGIIWTTATSGWTIRYVGSIAGSDTCSAWDGAHLHQGGDNSSWTAVYRNTTLPAGSDPICNLYHPGTNPCIIYPASDYLNRWINEYRW